MTVLTLTTTTGSAANDAYEAGFLDGELDAISQLPADMHLVRASWGDLHDPMWAAGYTDGFIHATTLNAPSNTGHQQERAA